MRIYVVGNGGKGAGVRTTHRSRLRSRSAHGCLPLSSASRQPASPPLCVDTAAPPPLPIDPASADAPPRLPIDPASAEAPPRLPIDPASAEAPPRLPIDPASAEAPPDRPSPHPAPTLDLSAALPRVQPKSTTGPTRFHHFSTALPPGLSRATATCLVCWMTSVLATQSRCSCCARMAGTSCGRSKRR
eukprot:363433-Chlamydomonas_euryale.AAC.21